MTYFDLPLPGPYRNISGGPVDPYYLLRVGVTEYRPYSDDAEAGRSVPASDRAYRTVNVAGTEKWWTVDLTDGGLHVKVAPSSGGGGGATTKLNYLVTTDGQQNIPLPTGYTDCSEVVLKESGGYGHNWTDDMPECTVVAGVLIVPAFYEVRAGDRIFAVCTGAPTTPPGSGGTVSSTVTPTV